MTHAHMLKSQRRLGPSDDGLVNEVLYRGHRNGSLALTAVAAKLAAV